MKIDIDKDDVLLTASGGEFLRLKLRLQERLGVKNVRSSVCGTLVIPKKFIGQIIDLVDGARDSRPSLRWLAENSAAAERDHANARSIVKRILETSDGVIENGEQWAIELDFHQKIAVNCMTTRGLAGLCLFDEQGVGKTVAAIAAWDMLVRRGEADVAFVVAPKTMVVEWEAEFHRFAPKYKFVVVGGGRVEKYKAAQTPADVYAVNYESVGTLSTVLEGIADSHRALLIADESFLVKNPQAKRSRALEKLRQHCVRAFVLCGTPAPNSARDIIHQFDIADGGRTFSGFRIPKDEDSARIAIMDRADDRGIYIRRVKEDVIDNLPAKEFDIVRVQMTPRQASLYKEARGNLELWLRRQDNTTFKKSLAYYIQKRIALLQICATPACLDETYEGTPGKYLALDKILDKVVDQHGEKVVVWSFFRRPIEDIAMRYQGINPVVISGETSAAERRNAIEHFQTDPGIKMIVANPAAAGAGITLTAASTAIYISYPGQAAHYLQSIDRIHRRGQEKKRVFYKLLVCDGTIEKSEVARLEKKHENQSALLGDKVASFSLRDALDELKT